MYLRPGRRTRCGYRSGNGGLIVMVFDPIDVVPVVPFQVVRSIVPAPARLLSTPESELRTSAVPPDATVRTAFVAANTHPEAVSYNPRRP